MKGLSVRISKVLAGTLLASQPVRLRGEISGQKPCQDTKPPMCHHLSICGPRTCPPHRRAGADASGSCVTPSCPSVPSQCLNAVRTVQSLACLEEADHTVGFILQLSSFMKEWHFHLPQLMRDVQVGPRTRCLEGSGEMLGDRVWWGLPGHLQ